MEQAPKSRFLLTVGGYDRLEKEFQELQKRRTEVAGVEGREIVFEMQGAGAAIERRSAWVFVSGPRAVTLVFKTRVASAGELEPLFKGVVQSVVFVRDVEKGERFEALRRATVGEASAARARSSATHPHRSASQVARSRVGSFLRFGP